MEKYFCIFGGGGIRGAAYSGALKALYEEGIEITGFAGSSIGAVVAGLAAFGYSVFEIAEVFENINFDFFKDINFNFQKEFALSKGGNFYEWIKAKIEDKFYGNACKERPPVCFKDLNKELVIYSVDLLTSKFHEFSKAKTPEVEVAYAIRVSVGMPGLYVPVFDEDECLADGDLLKSAPLWLLSETVKNREEKILEFRLENSLAKKKITNTFEYLNAVYDTVSGAASDYVIQTYKDFEKFDYIKLDLDGVSVVDFMISKDKKQEMAKTGYDLTVDYFKNKYPLKKKFYNEIYGALFEKFKKIEFFIKDKNITEARYLTACIFSDILYKNGFLDKNITFEIEKFKKLFDENYVLKKSFLTRETPALISPKKVLEDLSFVCEKINAKLNA